MSSESEADYAQAYVKKDRRYGRYRNRDEDDDEDDDNNSKHSYKSGRNRNRREHTSRNRHRRRRKNHFHDKVRRPVYWYSQTAARIMGICLLFSFMAYEVSILRTPLSTDLFSPMTSSHSVVNSPNTGSVRVSQMSPVSTPVNSASRKSLDFSSSSGSSKSSSSSTSSSSSESVSSQSNSAKRTDPTPREIERPKGEPLSVSDIPADSDTVIIRSSSEKKHSPVSEDSAGIKNIPERDVEDPGEKKSKPPSGDSSEKDRKRSTEFRPLRRRRWGAKPHSESSDSTSDSESASKSDVDSDVSSKTAPNKEPISALEISSGAADEDDKSSLTSSSKSKSSNASAAKKKKEKMIKSDSESKRGESEKDPEKDNETTDSASSTSSGSSGGSEPGAGENFWQWFQESKGNANHNVSATIQCPDDSKRLCTMFYKYIRKYKIRSVFDASCGKNVEWMPKILKAAGGELWGFKYYCSSTDDEEMANAKEKLSSMSFVEFSSDAWWKTGFPSKIEMLFAWDTLAHIAFGRVWNFFVKAKSSQVKYILIDNYPSLTNDPSPDRQFINVRRHPFKFPAAKEVVQNVTEPGETAKRQLLFYETQSLPGNLQ